MAQGSSGWATGLLAGLALSCFLISGSARADNFIGGDWTTGNGYRGFDVRGGADLDASGDWEGDAQYAYAHSLFGTESRSNELILGAAHIVDDQWSARGSLTGWRDTLNDVQYVGPSFGVTYTALSADEDADELDADDEDTDTGEEAAYKILFDSDFFFYKANAMTSGRTIQRRLTTIVIPPQPGDVRLLQWHPYLRAEKPFGIGGWLTPWAEVGHDFYTKNPSAIEKRAGRPLYAASANSLNGLVAGLFTNTAQAGINFKLPSDLKLTTSIGVEQLAIDNSWATTQSVGISQLYWDRLMPRLGWDHIIEEGLSIHLWSAGLTLFF